MGNQAGFRFGQDGPSRITVVPSMLTEASEIMPYEPVYYPVIPFVPPVISGGSGGAGGVAGLDASWVIAGSSRDDLKYYPDSLDLHWWQGDDVQIKLQIVEEEDMSAWEWHADVRTLPSYHTYLHYEFTIHAEFFPEVLPVAPEDVLIPAHTTVTLFLPRQQNRHALKGSWELHSIGPYEGPDVPWPPPPGVDVWPPTTSLKTWVYGNVTVVPRTNDTDYLPPQITSSVIPRVYPQWPNGMVP